MYSIDSMVNFYDVLIVVVVDFVYDVLMVLTFMLFVVKLSMSVKYRFYFGIFFY